MKHEKQGESWILTPETSESEQAILDLIARFGSKRVNKLDCSPTNHSRPLDPYHNTVF